MFVKNVLKILAISNVLVISMPFTLRDVGDVFLFSFFESISLMVFQVFLISDLYFSNVNAKIAVWQHICSFLIFYCMF